MGAQIGRELTRRELAFVVIERDPIVLEMLRENGVLHIEGDATSDSILLTAGVAHARGLSYGSLWRCR
jgi:voltage-gated potassium channel